MVHILNNDVIDLKTASMLYNLLSKIDNELYLIADHPYSVPNWADIAIRARYWFSKVHLIVGKPYYTRIKDLNAFDSLYVRYAYDNNTIFSKIESEYDMKNNELSIPVTIMYGRREEKFYKNYSKVDELIDHLPFDIKSILIDDDLKVYQTTESRIGDL